MYGVQKKLLEPFLLREPLTKPKIGLSDMEFHPFFCSKRLLCPKRHLKGNFYMAFEENFS